jgi:hypothetical protein
LQIQQSGSVAATSGSLQRQRQGQGQFVASRWHGHLRVVRGIMGIADETDGVKNKPASKTGRTDP